MKILFNAVLKKSAGGGKGIAQANIKFTSMFCSAENILAQVQEI